MDIIIQYDGKDGKDGGQKWKEQQNICNMQEISS